MSSLHKLLLARWRVLLAIVGFGALCVVTLQVSAQSDDASVLLCLDEISGSAVITGIWDSDCLSEGRPVDVGNESDYYARFYAFTLDSAADVTIALTSEEAPDTYLYLRRGNGKSGAVEIENDDVGLSNQIYHSRIEVEALPAGDYTIEATTYNPLASGAFTLTVEIEDTTAPPTPTSTFPPMPTATHQPDGTSLKVAVGANHICWIDQDGRVSCQGMDDEGQSSNHPTSDGFKAVSVGAKHSCALDRDGYVECWGNDEHGQSSPLQGNFVSLHSGDDYTCGVRPDSEMECWGLHVDVSVVYLSPPVDITPTFTATATLVPPGPAVPTATATAAPQVEPTATYTPRPTATHTPRPTATHTPRPTATHTPEASNIVSVEPLNIPSSGILTDMAYPSDGTNRLFVSNKAGQIKVFKNRANVSAIKTFLDIRSSVYSYPNEAGLLSFAFDPNYGSNGYFYVHYNEYSNDRLYSVISRFKVSDSDEDAANPTSEKRILRLEQPDVFHNGGKIAFGKDGYLYIAFGYGGKDKTHSRNLANLLGSIIRIDVSPSDPNFAYSVPSDNPFANDNDANTKGEIWAYGLRNPWRFSFDRQTGDLWAGDVGEHNYEEVNIIRKGRNYGWNIMEGFECHSGDNCDSTGLEPPIAVYENTPGPYVGDCSITGGYVYRGNLVDDIFGKYIYADYCSGKIWALEHNGSSAVGAPELLIDSDLYITSFGEDQAGELYILSAFTGLVYTLQAR